jgi:hypothetical protein
MSLRIMNGEGKEIIITPEEFIQTWKKVGGFMSSLSSGVHYGHYKAVIQNLISTGVLALQLTVIAHSGIPPESWSVGLQVMLEKIAGVCLVEKLWAIQLYKADFNCYNQFIFSQTAMESLTPNDYLPEELFSKKGCTAEDAKFDKTLMANLSKQARHPMTVVSADAAYCYNRLNHLVMLPVWLVLMGNTPAIVATLICLQNIKFFQQTGFGDSKSFFGGPRYEPYMMGMGQGNHAAPPSWIQLSAVTVNVYKQLRLGADIHNLITDNIIHSMGAMFVDDLDLYTWKDIITDPVELMLQAQREVSQWSLLLNATGGGAQTQKMLLVSTGLHMQGGRVGVHISFRLQTVRE